MPEYIEREELLKEVDDLKKSPWYNDDYGNGTRQARHDGVDCVVSLCIKQAPSCDVVKVVRCSECKYFGKELKQGKHICLNYQLPYCLENDYCSYGERKDSD